MKGSIILALIISVVCPVIHTHHIFVYGTLKKGQPNHFRMENTTNGQAEFLARAQTVERYLLVIGTENNIPFLLNVSGSGHRVYGEIYRVDKKMLDFLDRFEECPKWYQRTKIRLEVQDGEGENTLKPGNTEAFVYIKTSFEPKWLQKPTYESYDAYGDDGLKYIDSDTIPTPNTTGQTQQNTTEPTIISNAVHTECGVEQFNTTNPQQ